MPDRGWTFSTPEVQAPPIKRRSHSRYYDAWVTVRATRGAETVTATAHTAAGATEALRRKLGLDPKTD